MTDQENTPPPYRVKAVEEIHKPPRAKRRALIEEAGYNPFLLDAEHVYVDLLTDSGTGAMSAHQWAGLMEGDESYAGSQSMATLADAVRDVLGFSHVLPTHQGRGAEKVVADTLLDDGAVVIGNAPFDTTRAHVENQGARVLDCTIEEAQRPGIAHPFKGNADPHDVADALTRHGEDVAFVLMTVTCNTVGGQPVSLQNLRKIRKQADRAGVPLFLDAARFAENAYLIQEREPGLGNRFIPQIVREMTDLADAVLVSGKKNALVNIGGFIATDDEVLFDRLVPSTVLNEGFPTYGGLAGRDLEAMGRGLREVVDERLLEHRVGQVAYLHGRLDDAGIPLLSPPGGHAVYVDALRFLPDVPRDRFPGQTLAVELYVEGGVRGVEIGAVMAGRDPETGDNRWPENEYLRLAIPARTYTQAHLAHVAGAVERLWDRREDLNGYQFAEESPQLRHFTSTFQPAEPPTGSERSHG